MHEMKDDYSDEGTDKNYHRKMVKYLVERDFRNEIDMV